MVRAFDPGNLKFYKNVKEHVTKQAPKSIEDTTKKLVQDMQPKKHSAKPRN